MVDVDRNADPPKLMVIGPDKSGNLLEVIVLELADVRFLAIHAMRLRAMYHGLLPSGEGDDG